MNYFFNGVPAKIESIYDNGMVLISVAGAKKTVGRNQLIESQKKITKVKTVSKSDDIETEEVQEPSEKINLNSATFSDLVNLKSIGRTSARTILNNKPEDGYKNIHQLKQLNNDIKRIDWEVVESQIVFS